MLTLTDINKLTRIFATKHELQEVREEMATKDDMRRAITMLENVMGELKIMREEQIVHAYVHEEITEYIKDLKSRVVV